jgi:isoaspartyl peptidase/L-asparaginase-like protein (Ntn-hydrolase superfamily)
MADVVVIATWSFGRLAAQTALPLLQEGKSALDAALAGAQAVEDDPTIHSVGFGGLANSIGNVSLDACVMDGANLACGGVAGLENVRHAAALARRVMEKTANVLLVGQGAQQFALQQGFALETLSTPQSVAEWEKMRDRRQRREQQGNEKEDEAPSGPPMTHDTVTVLALDRKGSQGGVCSTSGMAHKLPGRVGDSPLIGSGLYVDNSAGAAGATGVGEEIIRIGGSLLIVEALRAGKTPQEACEAAVRRVNATAVRRGIHPAKLAFLALDPRGRIGAAATERTHFEYAVGRKDGVEMFKAKELGPEQK